MNTSIERILDDMKLLRQNVGVIATTNGVPEAAVIYFTYDEELNIYFATRIGSRKFANLAANPYAAFVIFDEAQLKTVQLEGTVSVVDDVQAHGTHYSQLVDLAAKNKPLPPIDQLGETKIAFMKLTTTWARAGNFEITRTGDVFEEVQK